MSTGQFVVSVISDNVPANTHTMSAVSAEERNSQQASNGKRASNSRGPTKKSLIWKYFGHSKMKVNGKWHEYSFCKVKPDDCTWQGKGRNTTNMKQHLSAKHRRVYEEFLGSSKTNRDQEGRAKAKQARSMLISGMLERQTTPKPRNPWPNTSVEGIKFRGALTRLAACTSFPNHLVESGEFRDLIAVMGQRYADTIPLSHNTMKNWIVKYTETEKEAVVKRVKAAKGFYVVMDVWTQPGLTYSYLGVIVIFFCKFSSKIEVAALACRWVERPHTAAKLKEHAQRVLTEHGLGKEDVIRYFTDDGANIIAALKEFVQTRTVIRSQYVPRPISSASQPVPGSSTSSQAGESTTSASSNSVAEAPTQAFAEEFIEIVFTEETESDEESFSESEDDNVNGPQVQYDHDRDGEGHLF